MNASISLDYNAFREGRPWAESMTINGRPIQAAGQGGVRVWNSPDGRAGGVIIIRRGNEDEEDD